MSQNQSKPDFYSGIPWVYVTGEQARSLQKGRLNLTLWVIVGYFIAVAALGFWLVLTFDAGLGTALLYGVLPLLTGLGLAFRMPWSIVLAMIVTGLSAYALIRGLGGNSILALVQTIANIGILFYLVDGDRPNLIYRHRYRKYSVQDDTDRE